MRPPMRIIHCRVALTAALSSLVAIADRDPTLVAEEQSEAFNAAYQFLTQPDIEVTEDEER